MNDPQGILPALYAAVLGMVVVAGLGRIASAHDFDIEVPGLDPIISAVTDGSTLFQNVRVFEGKSSDLSPPSNVLIRGNIIERIPADTIKAAGARPRIDARTDRRSLACDDARPRAEIRDREHGRAAGALQLRKSQSRKAWRSRGGCAGRSASRGRQSAGDVNLVSDPGENFLVIMKDGRIYKDSLPT